MTAAASDSLAGTTAIVTGVNHGFGRAVSEELCDAADQGLDIGAFVTSMGAGVTPELVGRCVVGLAGAANIRPHR